MKHIEMAENLECGASSKAVHTQAIPGAVVDSLIRVVEASGWRGPIGVIHERPTVDAAEGIKGNLQGLEWVQKELRQPGSGGPKPQEPTTPQPDTKNAK